MLGVAGKRGGVCLWEKGWLRAGKGMGCGYIVPFKALAAGHHCLIKMTYLRHLQQG